MTLKRIAYGVLAFVLLSGAAFQYRGIRHDLATTITSGTTRVLTNTSTQVHRFTGSTVQDIKLPSAQTLQSGMWYLFINESSTRLNIYNHNSELVTQVSGGSQSAPLSKRLYLTANSTTGGPWTIDQGASSGSSGSSSGGSTLNSYTATLDYSVSASDDIVYCNATGSVVLTMPSVGSASQKFYIIKNINTGECSVQSTALIDNDTTLVLRQYDSIHLFPRGGTTWSIH